MIIKVCGLKEAANMVAIDQLQPDLLGMIFYARSARYVDEFESPETSALKVGVFVDEDPSKILEIAKAYQLQYIQLHGNETIETVKLLVHEGYKIIKAFSIKEKIPAERLKDYAPYCSYFLFDTAGANPGGNGVQFNWDLLRQYTLDIPFLLSGGIGPEDAQAILKLDHPAFAGIDINSRFEEEPGIKNIELTKQFIHACRTEQT